MMINGEYFIFNNQGEVQSNALFYAHHYEIVANHIQTVAYILYCNIFLKPFSYIRYAFVHNHSF